MQQNSSQASAQIMNDKDMCYDILTFQKYALQTYTIMIMEASDPKIRTMLQKQQEALYAEQYDMWKAMVELGYYKTKPAAPADITEAITQAKTMCNQLAC